MKTISLRRGVLLLVAFAALLMTPTTSSAQGKLIKASGKAISSAAKSHTIPTGFKTQVPISFTTSKIDAKSSTATTSSLLNSHQPRIIALPKIDSTMFNNKPMLNNPLAPHLATCAIDVTSNDTITNALRHINNKEYDKAKEILTPLAEGGDMNAQFYMGVIYMQSDCKYKDINVAMSWFRRAAEQGHESAKKIMAEIEKR